MTFSKLLSMFFYAKTRRILVRQRILAVGLIVALGLLTLELRNNISIHRPGNRAANHRKMRREIRTHSHEALNETQNSEYSRNQNILLLSSMGRSGSSFLGGLLSSLPGVFYYFEPFYNFQQWGIHTQTLAVESLKELYLCNYTGPVFKAVRARGRKSFRHPYFNSCHAGGPCFDPARLQRVCSREPIRLVKTIRTRVSWLPPLLQDPDLNLRVVHIVRDPRASIISNWKAGWNVSPKNLCNGLLNDLEHGPLLRKTIPNRYIAVRYEDLCADPETIAKIILQFLGYRILPPSIVRFLNRTTSKNGSLKDTYSLRRNSTEQQQKWRHYIHNKELTEIESSCSDAIRHLGFNLFGDIHTTKNLSFPLFNDSSVNALFSYEDYVNL